MNIEVNYKNKKRYKTAKYPMHQTKFWTWLIWLLSKIALMGKAKLTHDPENGFILEGFYRGQTYHIQRQPAQTNSLHVEYDFGPIDKKDCVDISYENDSFYCRPSQSNVITKLAFATEEIYLQSQKSKAEKGKVSHGTSVYRKMDHK